MVEVVTFTGTFTHTGEYGQTAVLLGDVVDQFHHVHGLAHTGATEQTHLTTLGERTNQVNHLDAGFQQVNGRRQFVELRCLLVNGTTFVTLHFTCVINGTTQHVHDTTQGTCTHRHRNGVTRVDHGHAALQTIGRTHCNGANNAVAQLLLYFKCQTFFGDRICCWCQFQCFIHFWHLVTWEFNIHHRANTLNNLSLTHFKIPRLNLILSLTAWLLNRSPLRRPRFRKFRG